MSEILLYEKIDAVAVLTINDAPYNRMSLDFMDNLEKVVDELSSDSSIRSVVLTASGLDNFSVGMNLKQLPEGIERKGIREALFDQRLSVIEKIENMNKWWKYEKQHIFAIIYYSKDSLPPKSWECGNIIVTL